MNFRDSGEDRPRAEPSIGHRLWLWMTWTKVLGILAACFVVGAGGSFAGQRYYLNRPLPCQDMALPPKEKTEAIVCPHPGHTLSKSEEYDRETRPDEHGRIWVTRRWMCTCDWRKE